MKRLQNVTQSDNSLRPDQGELAFSSRKEDIKTLEWNHVWHIASLSVFEKVREQCPVAVAGLLNTITRAAKSTAVNGSRYL